MNFRLPFGLPPPAGCCGSPEWTGLVFRVDGRTERVIAYGGGGSGWTDALTTLHEDAAGGEHFIDVASRRHAVRELSRTPLPSAEPVILEVGCSGGHFLRDMIREFPAARVIGADYTLGTLRAISGALPGVPLLQFDLACCPLPDSSVDAVVVLNVLEHIEHDDLAIRHLFRILKPGGAMIVEVPAGPELYDDFDAYLMHFRRYTMRGLEALVREAGFEPTFKSHLGFLLYPAFWCVKKAARWRQHSQRGVVASERQAGVVRRIEASSQVGGAGGGLMAVEYWLRRRAYLPFGMRALMTCRRP